jgi:predicted dehydrogenase
MTEPKLRWGLVGGGKGAFFGPVHRMAARLDGQFDLVAGAFSADVANNRGTGAELHLDPSRVYDRFEEMAQREAARPDGVQLVTIATPNHLHYQAARAFLAAGIHVLCEKPMTRTHDEAVLLADDVAARDLIFVLAHTYTGYPMVREARQRIQAGELGRIRLVQVEYAQDWLATNIERTGSKQAEWRLDPARSGPAGALGDIGTHGFNLIRYVTGLELSELAADLHSFGAGRVLDDNAHVMLRFASGAKGMLWASQVAVGKKNALVLRVYGEMGALEWAQETPDALLLTRLGESSSILLRGSAGLGSGATAAARLPAGHPEGYLEALAQLYADTAALLRARGSPAASEIRARLPGVQDGVEGVRFVEASLESAAQNGRWVPFPSSRSG